VRRLRDYQRVSVHGTTDSVTARVVSLHGDQVVLDAAGASLDEFDATAEDALLAFDHDGHLITLSGTVFRGDGPGLLRFLCTDGVRLADKREHERLTITLPATATPVDGTVPGPPPIATKMLDISAGGVLLEQDGLRDVVRLAIEIPGSGRTVKAVAVVIRNGVPGSAVMFRTIDPHDQALIQDFIRSVKHALAKRFAAA
jgi:hypothetical protein